MQDYSYSVFSLAAIVIHLIINFKLLIGRGEDTSRGRSYRNFLLGTLAYYVFDGAWGIFAGLGWTRGLCMSRLYSSSSRLSHLFSCGGVLSSPILNSAKGRLVFSPCSGMRFWPSTSWQLQPTHSTDASFISIPKAFTKQVTCEIQPSISWLPSMSV